MNNLQAQYEQNQQTGGAVAQSSASREMEEVKGQIFMARQFPRNVFQAENRILDACKRPALAQGAIYSYPRGGTKVTGPSIRLAEVLAQNWGNLSFGVQEIEQREGESVAKAFCWDLETNVRQEKIFTVPHSRKANGKLQKLNDPRDIYELVANNGSRRVRACILGVIPGDIVEKAVEECNKTMAGANETPLKDRIANGIKAFKENYKVTQEQIEEKFGYNVASFSETDYVELINIFNSLKDGMAKPADIFSKKQPADKQSKEQPKSNLTEAFEENETKDVGTSGNGAEQMEKEDVKADDSDSEQASFDIS
ncbi:hypothetical protein [Oceanobacillus locisalsi]|uniref:Uncharacterized protein n=1 Tax=Oceanobacillus locisalsi TaxID=546107 RepID=A0ABW3NG48_9BACI